MSSALDVAQLVIGIAVLYWGSEWLVRGSAALARGFGVRPIVVGFVVVAYANSAPELAVATKTALAHSQPIALGTVIGSCAANIALVLGLGALIAPPTIDGRIIRREVPILVGSALIVPLLLRNGILSQLEGLLLVGCALLFTVVTLVISARQGPGQAATDPAESIPGSAAGSSHDVMMTAEAEAEADQAEAEAEADQADATTRADASGARLGGRGRPRARPGVAILMSLGGVGLLLFGAAWLVAGGRAFAAQIGMSERMLGLTIIALGTSLPELIGSINAAARGNASRAVGSVIGSNLLNVFLVLGVTAYLRPIDLGERMHVVDLVGLVAITLLGVIMLRGSRRISRFEGGVLVASYIGFIVAAALL